jgi:hypothetical protein
LKYRLLDTFQALFDGKVFHHRVSTHGDHVAIQLYEDLYHLNRSAKYVQRVASGLSIVNRENRRQGIVARRGDGSFGEIIPHETPVAEGGYMVKRGPIATIEIGIEVKIIQKAMIRQIDRVINDLKSQVQHFKKKKGTPITVGVVGVNRAEHYVSYEGTRRWATTGEGKYKHPYQEADEIISRLSSLAAPDFDEFLLLEFIATNDEPFPFRWVNAAKTGREYGAILVRISNSYETG